MKRYDATRNEPNRGVLRLERDSAILFGLFVLFLPVYLAAPRVVATVFFVLCALAVIVALTLTGRGYIDMMRGLNDYIKAGGSPTLGGTGPNWGSPPQIRRTENPS